MSTKTVLAVACGAAAAIALTPAMASAAVKFGSVTLSESVSATAGASTASKNRSKTYGSLAAVKGPSGVGKTAESTASGGGASAHAIDTSGAAFNTKRQGALLIEQEADTDSNKKLGSASAQSSGLVSYQFDITGARTYEIDLAAIIISSGSGGSGVIGDLVATLFDTTNSTYVFSSTGGSFPPVTKYITAGSYLLSFGNSGDTSSTSAGKNDVNVDGADTSGFLAFNIMAVPEPATWAMMLLGLGGIGAMARRRRRLETAAASLAVRSTT